MEQKIGRIVAVVVFVIVGLVFFLNLKTHEPDAVVPQLVHSPTTEAGKNSADVSATGPEETLIGQTERHGMRIAAVWRPPMQLEAQPRPQREHAMHLKADIHAREGNRNGFASGAWIPYLTVTYQIIPREAGEPIRGELVPTVTKDGPHYGATVELPGPGTYALTYRIDNPSKKGLVRHIDSKNGVEPWWDAFEVTFDLEYAGGQAHGGGPAEAP